MLDWTAPVSTLTMARRAGERRRINAMVRQGTFDWLDRNHYSYIPSVSNCFLLDTGRPGRETIEAMAKLNVFVGRVWPSYPNHVRITVGTQEEMARFQEAFQKVMTGAVALSTGEVGAQRTRSKLLS